MDDTPIKPLSNQFKNDGFISDPEEAATVAAAIKASIKISTCNGRKRLKSSLEKITNEKVLLGANPLKAEKINESEKDAFQSGFNTLRDDPVAASKRAVTALNSTQNVLEGFKRPLQLYLTIYQ